MGLRYFPQFVLQSGARSLKKCNTALFCAAYHQVHVKPVQLDGGNGIATGRCQLTRMFATCEATAMGNEWLLRFRFCVPITLASRLAKRRF